MKEASYPPGWKATRCYSTIMEDWNSFKMVDCGRGGREEEEGMGNMYA